MKYTDNAAGAYPALLVTYEIVCSKGLDRGEDRDLVKDFLGYFASPETQGRPARGAGLRPAAGRAADQGAGGSVKAIA